MCFSAVASFAGGLVITSIGITAISKIRNRKKLLFAAIPVFFGVQQFIEGFVWLMVPHPEYLIYQKIGANLYLVFAHVLWPLLIPLSVLLMEEDARKIKFLKVLTGLGLALTIFYSSCLILYSVTPQINCYHMLYDSNFPLPLSNTALIFYLICVFAPLFISSNKRTKIMGWLMLISCFISVMFFTIYLTSVWCFFAAIISIVVFWITAEKKISSPGINLQQKTDG